MENKKLPNLDNHQMNNLHKKDLQKVDALNKKFGDLEKKYWETANSQLANKKKLSSLISLSRKMNRTIDKRNALLMEIDDIKNGKYSFKNKLKKIVKRTNKSPLYATKEVSEILKMQIEAQMDELSKRLTASENEYLELGAKMQGKKNKNLKKLAKIDHLQKRLKEKIQKCQLDLLHLDNGTYCILNIFQKFKRMVNSLSYQDQKVAVGILFVMPWLIGFMLFFAKPLLTTFWWSVNEVTPIAGGLEIHYIGFKNYSDLFRVQMLGNRTFLEVLTVSVETMLVNVPVILIFSLIIAVILNTKFKGHQLFKAIFFIPVIYNTTVINSALNGDVGSFMSDAVSGISSMVEGFENYLMQFGMAEGLVTFLTSSVDRIFTIVNQSGIQILIFIAALQSIPKHLYEAAKVEGATKYECFWKITFPMVSSMFLPIIIFSIVDCFATSDLMYYMTVNSQGAKIPYGMSSTIAVIYFSVNALIILIIFGILRKVVYSND